MALALCACAELQYPNRTEVQSQVQALPQLNDANSARGYIAAGRYKLLNARSNLNFEEGLTDVGISGGAVFTVLGGALHWASRTVIDSTAISGTSYAISQTRRPRAQLDVLDAGLSALDCIGSKAEPAYRAASSRTFALHPVVLAKQAIEDDEKTSLSASLKLAADEAIKNANAFLDANQSQTYQQVRLAVDATLTSTFTQVRKATADPTAVQHAFAAIAAVPSPQPSTSQPQPSNTSSQELLKGNLSPEQIEKLFPEEKDAATKLNADIGALNFAIETAQGNINSTPDGSQTLDLKACAPGAIVLVINPAGDVTISPSQSYGFTVTGGQHAWSWSGTAPAPTELTLTQSSSNSYLLTASSSLKPNQTYSVTFTPFADGSPKTLPIKTVAAPSAGGDLVN